MDSLDYIDKSILFELDKNSRVPVAALAKRLKLSRDRIGYRMKRLLHSGVLAKCTATINPYQIGQVVYKTYIRLEKNHNRISRFLKTLEGERRIYWYAECDGDCDIIFAAYSKTPEEFSNLQDGLFAQFGDIILESAVYTLVEAKFFRKHYLVGGGTDSFTIGGALNHRILDVTDRNILSALAENARYSLKELVEIVDAAPLTIANRIKKLEEQKIIVGYRVDLDHSQLGMTSFKAQLYLHNFSHDAFQQIYQFAQANPFVSYMIRQLGLCKVELELEVESYEQYIRTIDDLRERFSKLIRTIETIRIKRQKYRWMPEESAV